MSQLLEKEMTALGLRSLKLLNLGCGQNFHPDWINLDIEPCSPEVQKYDLRQGLNFPDCSFDVCYSSHVLEHLKSEESKFFLQESFRVLKPGGIIRVVVPDLEGIVQLYLSELERAEQGIEEAQENYDWMILELLDQLVRTQKSGQMGQYLQQLDQLKYKSFVLSRLGDELSYFEPPVSRTFLHRLLNTKPSRIIEKARYAIAGAAVGLIAGRNAQIAFKEGLFRNSGEVHRWMYDRYSLKQQLQRVGFEELEVLRADESKIPNFNHYNLDLEKGRVKKPDSLFVEGVKPQ